MSKLGVTYDEGHLVVAAIRVLEHKLGRPPTVEEMGELLGRSAEMAHLHVRGLEEHGIVKVVKTPFETRLEIVDHGRLEELPRGEQSAAFGEDLDAFHEKKKKEQEAMEAFFASGGEDDEKRKKLDTLNDAFQKFQKSKRDIFTEDEEQ